MLTLSKAGIALIDCVHKTPPAADSGYPYIAIPQMVNGRLNLRDARRITKGDFDDWTRKAAPRAYDVVLSRRCNPGETAFVPHNAEFALGQNLVLLRTDESHVRPAFLRWLVRGPEWWDQIQKFLNVGAVFDSLRCADVPKFELRIPPLATQDIIADTLGSLDDKIELNRRMNETLEAMARSIFKSWFVDFDPVRAKAEGRKPPGLDPATADLFPDSFEESELGPIPKGWDCRSLPEVIEVNPSRSLRKGEVAPYLAMAHMPTRGHSPENWIDRPFGSGMRFINGDTLVARITPCLENGKTAFVDFLNDGQVCWGSTEYIVLRPKPPLPPLFAYCLARNDGFRTFAIQRMTGSSGRQRVPHDSLQQFNLAVPPEEVATAFRELIEPPFARVKVNMDESRTLATIRDALLPRLLSGEIRVGDAERIVDDAPKLCRSAGNGRPALSADPTAATRGRGVSRLEAVPHANDSPPTEEQDEGDTGPTPQRPVPIDEIETDVVMAAFRQACRGRGAMTREELLKDVSVRLGYRRLGQAIEEALRGHLRAAVRRQIVGTDGPNLVYAETANSGDYTTDELIEALCSVMRRGREYDREDVIRSVASYLGFSRVTAGVRKPLKSAINAAIRRGILEYEGKTVWREE